MLYERESIKVLDYCSTAYSMKGFKELCGCIDKLVFNINGGFMHYLDIDFIEDLITAKIKGSVIRRSMFLRLLSNGNFDYQTKDYELVIKRLIKDGKLIETDGFIRHKGSEDLTKLFVEHNGVRGIWASKT